MFRTISYTVEVYTGRVLTADVTFDKGMTAIHGANEAGKSFLLEMLRYMLYGSAALRSTSDTYTSIDLTGTFDIRGVTYTMKRTKTKATLTRAGEIIASGHSVVNDKITRMMGFGLDVFDVACAANQDALLKLSQMKPTERKRLVDSVIGIGGLEAVAKWAKDEALALEREAKGAQSTLVKPTEPMKPEGYIPSSELMPKLRAAEDAHNAILAIDGWLSHPKEAPTQPTTSVQLPADALRKLAGEHRENRIELEKVTAQLAAIPERAPFTAEQIDAMRDQNEQHDQWKLAQRWLKQNPKPDMDESEAELDLQVWEAIQQTRDYNARRKQLQAEIKSHEDGMTECPSCQHRWATNGQDEHIEMLRTELSALGEEQEVEPPEPKTPMPVLRKILSDYEQLDLERHAAMSKVPQVEPAQYDETKLVVLEKIILQVAERPGLEAQKKRLESLLEGQDFERMLMEREQYEKQMEVYHRARADYESWQKQKAEKQFQKATLKPTADEFPALRVANEASLIFEASYRSYEAQLASYEKILTEIEKKEADAAQYRLVQEAMVTLRQRVKQYLLPSLNRVASILLSKMTSGARTSIVVDDEFDIIVDGQKVETLSGSALVCTNLALRIALGQVLVNNTFSVFLGDELDGSMDPIRAAETSLTLRNLAKSVSQVLIVSHKSIEADRTIVLGDLNDDRSNPGSVHA